MCPVRLFPTQPASAAARFRDLISLIDHRTDGAEPCGHAALLNVKIKSDRPVSMIDRDLVVRPTDSIVSIVSERFNCPLARRQHRRTTPTPEVPRELPAGVRVVVVVVERGIGSLIHPTAFA